MIGFYNYTVILTYLGLSSGVIGIMSAIEGKTTLAIICLMLSGFFDLFDGLVARTKERTTAEKRFGIQIDSLSDLICFGVLPAVIGYAVGMKEWYFYFILVLYVLCGLIRLAYFNVTEELRQDETTETRKEYEGLPITTAALIMPIVYTFNALLKEHFYLLYAGVMLLTAISFISKFKIKKFKKKGIILVLVIGLLELLMVIYL